MRCDSASNSATNSATNSPSILNTKEFDLPVKVASRSSKKDRLKCPFPGCDGKGHTNKKYPSHRRYNLLKCLVLSKCTLA